MNKNNRKNRIKIIIYGALLLFLFSIVLLLTFLFRYRLNLENLIENIDMTRDIITMKKDILNIDINNRADVRGYYNINSGECYKYLTINEEANCK